MRFGTSETVRHTLRLLVVFVCLGAVAHADDDAPRDETERWVPSFSMRSGVTASNLTASFDSVVIPLAGPDAGIEKSTITTYTPVNTPPFGITFRPGEERVFDPTNGTELYMGPWVGTSIELMTPGLQALPTRPRFFVHGDVQYNFAVERSIARIDAVGGGPSTGLPPGFQLMFDTATAMALGIDDIPGIPAPGVDFGGATSPLQFPAQSGTPNAPASIIIGQGSKVSVIEEPWVWQAGAGVAFTFELFDRRLRVKPSAEYQRRKLTIMTIANRALESSDRGESFLDPDGGGPMVAPPDRAPLFNIIQLQAEDELDIHGLGPGLELELDTWQAGPFMLSVFISGSAYRVLTDTKIQRSGDRSIPCSPANFPDGSNLDALCQRTFDFPSQQVGAANTSAGVGANDIYGDISFEIQPWWYQAGVGLRFRAVPDKWVPDALTNLRLPELGKPSWLPW